MQAANIASVHRKIRYLLVLCLVISFNAFTRLGNSTWMSNSWRLRLFEVDNRLTVTSHNMHGISTEWAGKLGHSRWIAFNFYILEKGWGFFHTKNLSIHKNNIEFTVCDIQNENLLHFQNNFDSNDHMANFTRISFTISCLLTPRGTQYIYYAYTLICHIVNFVFTPTQ